MPMLSEARNRKIEPAPTRASKGVEMEKSLKLAALTACFSNYVVWIICSINSDYTTQGKVWQVPPRD